MCELVTAITGALAIASTAASVVSQSKAAKAQEAAILGQQELVSEENRRQATNELFDQMRAARREQGRIRTAAGEAGLGLNSGVIEGLLLDTVVQKELNGDRTLANLESRHAAATAQTESALSRIQSPTVLGAGLQIGTQAIGAFSSAQAAKIAKSGGVAPQGGS